MDTSANLNVADLVTQSLSFIRVVTEFNSISGYDLELGIRLLNGILARLNASSSNVPFYYSFTFDVIANKQDYLIGTGPDADVSRNYLNNITYINIYFNQIKYPVQIIQDFDALSVCIQKNVTFLPSYARWYLKNDSSGNTYTVISFLYPPDQTYVCEVRGKPTLNQISASSTIYDLPVYYHDYLVLELGRSLIPYYGRTQVWTADVQQQYEDVKRLIKGTVELDLRVNVGGALLRYINPYYYLVSNQNT